MPPVPPPHPHQHRLGLRGLLVLLITLGFAACAGERPHRPPPGAMGPGEGAARAPIPKMEAQGRFFDGQIEVEAMLAPAGMKWSRDMESEGRSGGGRQGRGGGLRGGLGMGGGGRGGRGGSRRHGGGEGGPPESGAEGAPQGPPMHASNLPPIQLRLRLTNRGGVPAVVEVEDFDSTMGDFVVQPPKITIQPGESAEADPMVSRLGVTAEEIALTVKLRSGSRTEQQVLTLRAMTQPPTGAPPPEGTPSGPPPTATPAMPPVH